MNISVVIPCNNEENNITEITNRIIKVLNEMSLDLDKIIFIDDGSIDNSWNEIISLKNKHKNKILGIKFSRNFGHQNAVMAGLKFSKSDLTLIIDADLQDPPEVLKKMHEEMINSNANCVYGERESRKDSFFKKLTASIFYRFFNKLSSVKIPLDVGDFRLIDQKVCKNLNQLNENSPFIRGLVPWVGFKQVSVKYNRDERKIGNTSYNIKKMLKFTMDGILSFSNFPLRLSYSICFFSLLLLFILIFYTLNSYLNGNTVPGWSSIMMIILFFNSMHFLILAIFGEYLGRIHIESKKRPTYIISEVIEN